MEEADDDCAIESDVVRRAVRLAESGRSNSPAAYIDLLYFRTNDAGQVVAKNLQFAAGKAIYHSTGGNLHARLQ